MKAKILMFFLLVCWGTKFLIPGDFVLFLSGNYNGGLKIADTSHSRRFDQLAAVTIVDTGRIASNIGSSFGGSLGIMKFFTRNFGLSVSFHYMPNTQVDVSTNYKFSWNFNTVDNNSGYESNTAWTNTGEISAVPINFNIIYAINLGKKTLLNINGGLSMILSKLNLYSNMGYGVGFSQEAEDKYWSFDGLIYEYSYKTVAVVDWYKLDLKNEQNKTIWGGNIGVDIEQKISNRIGIFIGFQYLYAPKKTYTWQLEPKSHYSGEFDILYRDIAPDNSNLPAVGNITTEVKFSYFTLVGGLKFHF